MSAETFLHDIRHGRLPLHGRPAKKASSSATAFLEGLHASFPEAEGKPFASTLARLWVRWSDRSEKTAFQTGWSVGKTLRREYEEGIAGEFPPSILHRRLHLLCVHDYILMRDWL